MAQAPHPCLHLSCFFSLRSVTPRVWASGLPPLLGRPVGKAPHCRWPPPREQGFSPGGRGRGAPWGSSPSTAFPVEVPHGHGRPTRFPQGGASPLAAVPLWGCLCACTPGGWTPACTHTSRTPAPGVPFLVLHWHTQACHLTVLEAKCGGGCLTGQNSGCWEGCSPEALGRAAHLASPGSWRHSQSWSPALPSTRKGRSRLSVASLTLTCPLTRTLWSLCSLPDNPRSLPILGLADWPPQFHLQPPVLFAL